MAAREYVTVLGTLLQCVYDERVGTFLKEELIVPGGGRPVGFKDELDEGAAGGYEHVKSKVMVDAEMRAAEAKEAREAETRRCDRRAGEGVACGAATGPTGDHMRGAAACIRGRVTRVRAVPPGGAPVGVTR